MTNRPLENKVAMVTGASKGIGAEIARQLANAGAAVIVNYASDKPGAERVVKDIVENGGKAVAVQANLAQAEDVIRLFDECDRAFDSRLDVLVNNAGIFSMTPLETVDEQAFHKHFNVNVLGLILCSREAAKRFPSTGGSIVNLRSVVAQKGFGGSVVYSATKGAIDSATRVLASELAGKNVRVNAVAPGLAITEGTNTAGFSSGEFLKAWTEMAALSRAGQPSDIASVVVFLASEGSGWLTGEVINAGGVR